MCMLNVQHVLNTSAGNVGMQFITEGSGLNINFVYYLIITGEELIIGKMNFPRNGRQVYACHALYNPNIESPFHIDIVTSSNMKSMFCSRILILFSQTLENLKRD